MKRSVGRFVGQLEAAEQRFRAVTENAASGLVLMDREGCADYLNPAAERILGYSLQDLKGRLLHDVMHSKRPDGAPYPAEECPLVSAFRGGKRLRDRDEWLVRADGSFVNVLYSTTPILSSSGEIVGAVLEFRDLSETQAAQARLASQERFLRKVIDTAPSVILVKDREHRYLLANRAAGEFYGASTERIVGRLDRELGVLREKTAQIHAAESQVIDERRETRLQLQLRDARGESRWYDVIRSPIIEADGGCDRLLIIATAIDQLKAIEESLRESEEKFRQLANNVPQLIWTATPDGLPDFYNERWYEYTGVERGTGGLGRWVDVVHPEDVKRVDEVWSHAIKAGSGFYELEFRIRNAASGEYRWFLARANSVRDASGRIVRWIGSDTDIQELRQAQADRQRLLGDLQRANEDLERRVRERTESLARSNRELEQFAYAASHDLQTPLRHISSYVQLIATELRTGPESAPGRKVDPKLAQWMGYVLEGTARMKDLIRDLLEFSRAGRSEKEPVPVDLNRVVSGVISRLEPAIREAKAEVRIEGLLPSQVPGVESMMVQLFQNLIDNAIKFRSKDRKPEVVASAQDLGEEWEIQVRDNGIGIDPRYAEKIFTVFQRLHTQEEYPGTGIGLAICKKIAEAHRGSIRYLPRPGGGSVFAVRLPRRFPASRVQAIAS